MITDGEPLEYGVLSSGPVTEDSITQAICFYKEICDRIDWKYAELNQIQMDLDHAKFKLDYINTYGNYE
jgi:hypothetical protein